MDKSAQVKSQLRIRREFGAYKTSLGCTICGYNRCAAALDFHHKDPKQKERRVPIGYYTALGRKELEKCVLLCKNCHYEAHSVHMKKSSVTIPLPELTTDPQGFDVCNDLHRRPYP